MRGDHPPGGLGGDQKGLAGMQVVGGKRQAVLCDGIEYPPGGRKKPPVLSGGQPAHVRRSRLRKHWRPRRVLDEMPRVDRRHPDDPAALARRLQDGVLVQAADRIAQYRPAEHRKAADLPGGIRW
jgi:hypothetical protein